MPDFGSFRGFGEKLTQGQTPTQLGLLFSLDLNPLLLDVYTNATVAYSLRKLRKTYNGSAIRVRRSSDNTEQDIGFNGTNLDTGALTSFCGAGNGFVTTLYDQSNIGINAVQTTAANQPQIVSNGILIEQNNKPSMQFNGSTQRLMTAASTEFVFSIGFSMFELNSFSVYNQYSVIVDTTIDANALNGFWHEFGNARGYTMYNNGGLALEDNLTSLTTLITDKSYLSSVIYNKIQNNGYLNGVQFGSRNYTPNLGTTNRPLAIGNVSSTTGATTGLNGKFQELIIYPVEHSSNRINIESNINTYYGIY